MLSSSSIVKNRLYAAKLVIGHGLFGGQLEVGAEYTHTNRNDDYINPEGYLPTNYIELKDRNIAPFMEYSHPIAIGAIKAGIRYEHATFDYYLNGRYMEEESRTYNNFFPSISLTAQIGNVQGLVGYAAKIRRPSYDEMNGSTNYVNRFTIDKGNPFLKPSIIHDLTLQAMWKCWSLNASFQNTKDAIIT